jgi:hypothetical protein
VRGDGPSGLDPSYELARRLPVCQQLGEEPLPVYEPARIHRQGFDGVLEACDALFELGDLWRVAVALIPPEDDARHRHQGVAATNNGGEGDDGNGAMHDCTSSVCVGDGAHAARRT